MFKLLCNILCWNCNVIAEGIKMCYNKRNVCESILEIVKAVNNNIKLNIKNGIDPDTVNNI